MKILCVQSTVNFKQVKKKIQLKSNILIVSLHFPDFEKFTFWN